MAPLPIKRGKPFQSKLIPHEEFIRTLRRKRVSYRQIARILEQERGCKVYHKTIISFMRVRSKPVSKGQPKLALIIANHQQSCTTEAARSTHSEQQKING